MFKYHDYEGSGSVCCTSLRQDLKHAQLQERHRPANLHADLCPCSLHMPLEHGPTMFSKPSAKKLQENSQAPTLTKVQPQAVNKNAPESRVRRMAVRIISCKVAPTATPGSRYIIYWFASGGLCSNRSILRLDRCDC